MGWAIPGAEPIFRPVIVIGAGEAARRRYRCRAAAGRHEACTICQGANTKTLPTFEREAPDAAQAFPGRHCCRLAILRWGIAPIFWADPTHSDDRLRHPDHHWDSKQWRRRFSLSRLPGVRRADRLGFHPARSDRRADTWSGRLVEDR